MYAKVTTLKAFHIGSPESTPINLEGYSNGSYQRERVFQWQLPMRKAIPMVVTKEKGYSNGSLPMGKALRVVESQPQTMPYISQPQIMPNIHSLQLSSGFSDPSTLTYIWHGLGLTFFYHSQSLSHRQATIGIAFLFGNYHQNTLSCR